MTVSTTQDVKCPTEEMMFLFFLLFALLVGLLVEEQITDDFKFSSSKIFSVARHPKPRPLAENYVLETDYVLCCAN